MNLIINTSTLSSTGVTQVAVSFINECKKFPENYYHVFMSTTIQKEINIEYFPDNFKFYLIKNHPLYGIKGFKTRKQLTIFEKEIKPDFVFTIFGPSCWTPKADHIMGFANSYYVYPDSPFFNIINLKEKIKISILKIAHRYFLKRNGNYYICETDDMSNRLQFFLNIDRSNIFTVSNTYNHFYENPIIGEPILPIKKNNEFRLLVLSSNAIHKNLNIINKLIHYIEETITTNSIKFIMTLSDKDFNKYFSNDAKKYIINLGRVSIEKCPQIYSECDALFAPTLIESFSANYPEAMKMRKPILTSDLSFSHSICDEAALYFNPTDPLDIILKIKEIATNKSLYQELIKKGEKRLESFETATSRAEKYLKIIKSLI